MGNSKLNMVEEKPEQEQNTEIKAGERPAWETPRMEDVSEQVMAQPYIRFT
jgi:hypothetical protein